MQEENNIWVEIKNGNKDYLSKIFLEYHDDLFLFAKRFENDEDEVKDLIQELFFKLWKNRKSLNLNNNIKGYLFKSIRNLFNNKIIVDKRIIKENIRNEESFKYMQDDFSSNNDISESKKKKLISVLNEIPEKQREAIYLKYFQGFDIQEISEILNINQQSVRNNLHRAMSKLREKMLLQTFLSLV